MSVRSASPDLSGHAHVHQRRWLILATLCLGLILVVAANSSLNVAFPKIQAALGTTPSQLQWMVDAYSLVFAVLLLPAGAIADRFGRKTALQVGLAVFGLASLLATLSTDNGQLIALRGLMGVGSAFIMPGTLSILTNVFHDPVERQRAIAIWAGCAGLGGTIGPVISGFLLEAFVWQSVFFINVVLAIIGLVVGAFLLPNSSDPREATLDPVGVFLAILGIGSLLYGIIEGPANGWTSAETLGTIVLGLVVLGAFVAWELHTERPMLDMHLFQNRAFTLGSMTITLQYFAMFGLFFAVAQYLQISHGYTALEAGLAGIPIGVMGMIASPLSAPLVRRFGHRVVVGSGLLISAAGMALLVGVSPTTTFAVLFVGFCLLGWGNGQATAPSTTLIMASVPRAKSGVGSSVNDLSRQVGGALGIAVLGSVMASVYQNSIGHNVGSESLAARAGSSIEQTLAAAQQATGADAAALHHGAQLSFAHGFGMAMLVGAIVLTLNAALVWMRGISIDPDGDPLIHGPGPHPGAPEAIRSTDAGGRNGPAPPDSGRPDPGAAERQPT